MGDCFFFFHHGDYLETFKFLIFLAIGFPRALLDYYYPIPFLFMQTNGIGGRHLYKMMIKAVYV